MLSDPKKEDEMVGHAARMGEMRNLYKLWSENLRWRDQSEDLGVDRWIILEWILQK